MDAVGVGLMVVMGLGFFVSAAFFHVALRARRYCLSKRDAGSQFPTRHSVSTSTSK